MAKGTVNKVTLIGNLGADPDIRHMADGTPLATLSVATTEAWRDRETGDHKELTEWHRVVLRGRLAEIARDYLKKGSKAYFEGRNRTRKYEKDGIERYTTEVLCHTMEMLDSRNGDAQVAPRAAQAEPQSQANAKPRTQRSSPPKEAESTGGGGMFDDDIPFMRLHPLAGG